MAALAGELDRAAEYQRFSKAEATQRAYKADWKRFCEWAAERGVQTLPASPETVVAHLVWLADTKKAKKATIGRFMSSAHHFHMEAGLEFPSNSVAVRSTLSGIRRKLKGQQKKRTPLTLEMLTAICERLAATDATFRIRALLAVGWWAVLRSDSLIAIRRSHLEFVPEGLVIHLPASKTDQEGKGRDVGVEAQQNQAVCPVRLLREYLQIVRPGPDDLVFDMSKRTVSRIVKRVVADPAHGHKSLPQIEKCPECSAIASSFGSHSLRRGIATTLAEKGFSEEVIMAHGGWKNANVARGYVDRANLFKNNPTKGLAK